MREKCLLSRNCYPWIWFFETRSFKCLSKGTRNQAEVGFSEENREAGEPNPHTRTNSFSRFSFLRFRFFFTALPLCVKFRVRVCVSIATRVNRGRRSHSAKKSWSRQTFFSYWRRTSEKYSRSSCELAGREDFQNFAARRQELSVGYYPRKALPKSAEAAPHTNRFQQYRWR